MTAFDVIVLLGLTASAAIGFTRGAVRELIALVAFTAAALFSLASLPVTSALLRPLVHPPWFAAVAAALGGFVIVFVILGLLARLITAALDRRAFLGGANRVAGLLFGMLRGLVLVGLFGLVFNRVTPLDMRPAWIVHAQTYPLVSVCGRLMQALAPEGAKLANGVPSLGHKVFQDDGGSSKEQPPVETERRSPRPHHRPPAAEEDVIPSDRGYTERARKGVDDLVEKSR